MNIIYIRVSKEDPEIQDLESQLKAICEKFNLKEHHCLILQERGSAYDLQKIKKREKFIELLDLLFDSKIVTIKDLFLGNIKEKDINLFIWDYHRIIRNFEFSLLFGLLVDFYNIQIFSYKQGPISRELFETPIKKFARYILYSINAFSSEDYSYQISTNIKKTVMKEKGVTISIKGKKWGRRFVGLQGNTVLMTSNEIKRMNSRIKELIKSFKRSGKIDFYSKIQDKIADEYKIKISKSYISRIKFKKLQDANQK